jgi:hypothetical protein
MLAKQNPAPFRPLEKASPVPQTLATHSLFSLDLKRAVFAGWLQFLESEIFEERISYF